MAVAIIATSTVMYVAVPFAMHVAMNTFGESETHRRLRRI